MGKLKRGRNKKQQPADKTEDSSEQKDNKDEKEEEEEKGQETKTEGEKEKKDEGEGEETKEDTSEREKNEEDEPKRNETKAERKKRKRQEKMKKLIDSAVDFNSKLLQERYKRGPTYWDPHTRATLYYEKFDVCLVPEIVHQNLLPTSMPDPYQFNTGRLSPLRMDDEDGFYGFSERQDKRRRIRPTTIHCDTCGVEDKEENLLMCLQCGNRYHVACLQLKPENVEKMKFYGWKCMHCKTCDTCKDSGNEEKLLFCDACDRGFHTFCLVPPLLRNPTGGWYCSACVECKSCGSKSPGVGVSCRWRAEYTMCEACYQLYTENKYCPTCRKAYRQSEKAPMVQCTRCKWKYHAACDPEGSNEDPYLCLRCKSGQPADIKPEDRKRKPRRKKMAEPRRRGEKRRQQASQPQPGTTAVVPTLIVTPPSKEKKPRDRKRKRPSPSGLKKSEKPKRGRSKEKNEKQDRKRTKRSPSPRKGEAASGAQNVG